MTAKKTNTKQTAKATKAKTTKKTKAAAVPAEVTTTPVGECPRGGDHEWAGREAGEWRSPGSQPPRGGGRRTMGARDRRSWAWGSLREMATHAGRDAGGVVED